MGVIWAFAIIAYVFAGILTLGDRLHRLSARYCSCR